MVNCIPVLLKLTSKVQYKTCEKGEFHEIALRSLDDKQELLLNFPRVARAASDFRGAYLSFDHR